MGLTCSDLDQIAEVAVGLTRQSRPIIKKYFRQQPEISQKADKSPVTAADEGVERKLREEIFRIFPQHSIIGEEYAQSEGNSPYTWVIDPIDGTRAFSCGNPLFGTLIAVLHEDKPVFGLIDLPVLGQTWVGVEGRVSTLNGQQVRTADVQQLNTARITTTSELALGDDVHRFSTLAQKSKVVHYGGDCANYAHLASGWCDIVAESNLSCYDIMATIPIIKGAGGCISQWDGSPILLNNYDGTALATATQDLHAQAITLLMGDNHV